MAPAIIKGAIFAQSGQSGLRYATGKQDLLVQKTFEKMAEALGIIDRE